MNISCSYIVLYSSQPQRLMQFFTSIFDIENTSKESSFLEFRILDLTFRIIYKEDLDPRDLVLPLVFNLESELSLLELSQKIEFTYYRESFKDFELNLKGQKLIFSDPDDRKWILECKESFNHSLPDQNSMNNNCLLS